MLDNLVWGCVFEHGKSAHIDEITSTFLLLVCIMLVDDFDQSSIGFVVAYKHSFAPTVVLSLVLLRVRH
jgi:hypothetical protein